MTTPLATSESPKNSTRRSRLFGILGCLICFIAFALLFNPSHPYYAVPCALVGIIVCAIGFSQDTNKISNATITGVLFNILVLVIAIIAALFTYFGSDSDIVTDSRPSGTQLACEALATRINEDEKRGLNFDQIYADLIRNSSKTAIDNQLDKCASYFQSR